jgi:kumamolisin
MNDRKVFHDSVTPLPPQQGLTPQGLLIQEATAQNRSERMPVLFSLSLSDKARDDLEAKVERGETVSPNELRKAAPDASHVDKLVDWLKKNGYSDVEVAKDRSGIYAQASVDQIEKSLEVDMVRVTRDGVTYTAARNAPSLPNDVGAPVQAVVGLQPFRHAHKHLRMYPGPNVNRSSLGRTEASGPTPNIENAPPYLVPEILAAYGANGLNLTGKGQTIAILIDTFPADSDVETFWSRNNIPAANRVTKINVKGAALPAPSGEETLDVEWTSGVAREAQIRVYASGSLQFTDLDRALDQILADAMNDPSLRQVSISLGLGERFFGGPSGEIAVQHQKFLQLAALGVNVFVSSGDGGSNPDGEGQFGGPLQVEYESSDPCVVGVGGTTLLLGPNSSPSSEEGWAGAGGGKSTIFKRPAWQNGAGIPHGTKRLVPDVSSAADPNTGAFVLLGGKVQQIGGTSWAAPTWAGFCALLNEARANAKKGPIGFLNPVLYPLKGSDCFRDIVDGTNGAFDCGPGYDLVTGLGVPDLGKLIARLSS